GQHQVDLCAAVRDVDLLAIDEVAIAFPGDARDDASQVGARLGLGQVHGSLQLARHEAREVPPLQVVPALLLYFQRHAGLQPDDAHRAGVGARAHLEVRRVHERRQTVAAVLRIHRETQEARPAQLLVAGRDVRGDHHLPVDQLHLLVPVPAGTLGDRLADLAGGAQHLLEGGHLIRNLDAIAATEREVAGPVEAVVDEQLHVAVKDLLRHARLRTATVTRATPRWTPRSFYRGGSKRRSPRARVAASRARKRSRGIPRAPSRAMCGVMTWMSSQSSPRAPRCPTRWRSAIFDAFGSR